MTGIVERRRPAGEFDVFISYTSADREIALAVQRALERYIIPCRFRTTGRRRLRVFLDDTELRAGEDLSESLFRALHGSSFFVLISSKAAASSPWVAQELHVFLSHHSLERLLPILVADEPVDGYLALLAAEQPRDWGESRRDGRFEPKAADVRAPGPGQMRRKLARERLRVVAAVLGCGFDDLVQRQRRAAWLGRLIGVTVVLLVAGLASMSVHLSAARRLQELRAEQLGVEALVNDLLAKARERIDDGDAGLVLLRTAYRVADQAQPRPIRWKEIQSQFQHVGRRILYSLPIGGMQEAAVSAEFSPDGSRLLTASKDGSATIREVATGAVLHHLVGHAGPLSGAIWFRDGRRVATTSADHTIRVWDAMSGAMLHRLDVPGSAHKLLGDADECNLEPPILSPCGRYLAANDEAERQAWVWEVNSGRSVFDGVQLPSRILGFSPDGRTFAFCRPQVLGDNCITIQSVDDEREHAGLEGTSGCQDITFSPDARLLLVHGHSAVDVYAREQGARFRHVHTVRGRYTSARFSPDGALLVRVLEGYAREGVSVEVLDSASGEIRYVLAQRVHRNSSVAFTPEGRYLLTDGNPGFSVTRVWELATGRLLATLTGRVRRSSTGDFEGLSSDGERLATVTGKSTVVVYDLDSGLPTGTISHPGGLIRLALSRHGRWLATLSKDGKVHVWDADEGSLVFTLSVAQSREPPLLLSPDGSRVSAGAREGPIHIWDVDSGAVLAELDPSSLPSSSRYWTLKPRAFSTNNSKFALELVPFRITVWDVASRNAVFDPIRDRSTGASAQEAYGNLQYDLSRTIALSHDGRFFATGSGNSRILGRAPQARVGSADSGKLLRELEQRSRDVSIVAFSQNGIWLLTDGGAPHVWDWEAGELFHVFDDLPRVATPQMGSAAFGAFSPDGEMIAIVRNYSGIGEQGQVHVFDIGQKALVAAQSFYGSLSASSWAPDGRSLAIGSDRLRICDIVDGSLVLRCASSQPLAGRIAGLAFEDDGHELVSASDNGVLRYWHPSGNQLKRTVELDPGTAPLEAVALAADGRHVVTLSADHAARAWTLPLPLAGELFTEFGNRTSLRVCKGTLDIVSVYPFPAADSIWAPPEFCDPAEPEAAIGGQQSASGRRRGG